MNEKQFVADAIKLLKEDIPILYLHEGPEDAPAAVLMIAGMYSKLLALIPESDEVTSLVMQHDHIGAD